MTTSSSKTYSPSDFRDPLAVDAARRLRRFAFQLGWNSQPFAVNGVLRRRFWVRKNKMWEYARGMAFLESCVQEAKEGRNLDTEGTESQRTQRREVRTRVLDFGGAATVPIFYLAAQDGEVFCLDIDQSLSEYTNQLAKRRGWNLLASTHNLVTTPASADWGKFDAVISFSVLEHIPKPEQAPLLAQLAALLKPGGVFALTFDFGSDAPQPDAVRSLEEVARLVSSTGLLYADGKTLADSGERFPLDKRHPKNRFTFASLFLRKPMITDSTESSG
jgi:2-polyprenyl-3-methyl-5-hydroxy-6-metoxy-1,4-benzoquinol methylase